MEPVKRRPLRKQFRVIKDEPPPVRAPVVHCGIRAIVDSMAVGDSVIVEAAFADKWHNAVLQPGMQLASKQLENELCQIWRVK